MNENEETLLDLVDTLFDMIDEDGYCENGCSCGECENCIELNDAHLTFNTVKTNLTLKE